MITLLVFLVSVGTSQALCGDSIRWSHHVDMEEVYGLWYGVGYAQHTPDRTDRPDDVGCVTLYITDAGNFNYNWMDWTLPQRNYSNRNWLSYKNNPWSNTPMSGSWLDIRLKRQAKTYSERNKRLAQLKRDLYEEKRIRVLWDEDGQSMEQVYVYSEEEPGLWTAERYRPMERELKSHGVDVWYPDDPPRHPDVIRILRLSPDSLLINHCSDSGGGGIFTLILRRSPYRVGYWEWYELQKQFYNYDLPIVYRKSAVCAACWPAVSVICMLLWTVILKLL